MYKLTVQEYDLCGCSSMVESQPSKLVAWVRFPSPAPFFEVGRTVQAGPGSTGCRV